MTIIDFLIWREQKDVNGIYRSTKLFFICDLKLEKYYLSIIGTKLYGRRITCKINKMIWFFEFSDGDVIINTFDECFYKGNIYRSFRLGTNSSKILFNASLYDVFKDEMLTKYRPHYYKFIAYKL